MSALPSLVSAFGTATVWRADELAHPPGLVLATGHAALDSQLPGGGWPVGAMVEILQAQSGQNEWRLLLPALKLRPAGRGAGGRAACAVWAGAGRAGAGCSRACCGCAAPTRPQRLWASEQALRCAEVVAVLAWLPQARAEQLRRLQMAAAQHGKLLFVMRPAQAQAESSPAVLRLLVAAPAAGRAPVRCLVRCRSSSGAARRWRSPCCLLARHARLGALLALSEGPGARLVRVRRPQGAGGQAMHWIALQPLPEATHGAGGATSPRRRTLRDPG